MTTVNGTAARKLRYLLRLGEHRFTSIADAFDDALAPDGRQTAQRMRDAPDALPSLRYFSAASAFKAS
ncbi:hypothetical protein [Variovorax sp. LG9.2]|uniref:hypothetical protein n=1 Tax=Variovorax sp. LG9.2 TaxID=3048626 RepID=UPI002B2380EC|nr:hypothetical protein [Variovorax sp. LG9.2]MEB0057498.1 hypothetical protein [Variovorax sp. LG9.2]